jgi:transcriptional regulator with XRE-family HTH domain
MQKIGSIIKDKLKGKGFTVSEFARRINTNRNNVYDIFQRESIDTSLLQKISEVLEYNFFVHYAEDNISSIVSENPAIYDNINKENTSGYVNDFQKEIDYLKQLIEEKNKVIFLLEQQIQLLSKK